MKAIFTISSLSYLHLGITMFESLEKYLESKDIDFFYFLSDALPKEIENLNHKFKTKIKFLSAFEEFGDEIKFASIRYDALEFHVLLKAFGFDKLLKAGKSSILYFDPDIFFLGSPEEYFELLHKHDIIISPHHISIEQQDGVFLEHSKTGNFNLGFLAINSNGIGFIDWWKNVKLKGCYNMPKSGMFVDQKWIDQTPILFDKVYIDKHLGSNIAYWNFEERKSFMLSDRNPRFIHFSGFNYLTPNIESIYSGKEIDNIYFKFFSDYTYHISKNHQKLKEQNLIINFYRLDNLNGKRLTDFERKISLTSIDVKENFKLNVDGILLDTSKVNSINPSNYTFLYDQRIEQIVSINPFVILFWKLLGKPIFKISKKLNKITDIKILTTIGIRIQKGKK